MLKDLFPEGWMPGRDTFFSIMRRYGMMLKRPKPRHTTNSNHHFHKYKNLIKDFSPISPNQLWVSDITYIDLEEGCCYLHLVTDAYSRKIVGWCLAPRLEADYTLRALRKAISQVPDADFSQLIHHSDRGIQYCCNKYVGELNKYGVRISMTEDYKPTDNAIAERVNGIIKQELVYRDNKFCNIEQARSKIGNFIDFYNNRRPHMSIGMQTPAEAYSQTGTQRQLWKSFQKKDEIGK